MRGDQEARGRAKSPGRARSAIRHFRTEPSSAPFDVGTRPETPGIRNPAVQPAPSAANRTKRLCVGYGFRFVNGRLVASRQRHCGDWAPCTSFAPIVQRPTPSIWPRWARPAAPSAVPAARRSGWRGRRMRSSVTPAVPAMAAAGHAGRRRRRRRRMGGDGARRKTARSNPVVDSPSISADWPADGRSLGRRGRLAVGRPRRHAEPHDDGSRCDASASPAVSGCRRMLRCPASHRSACPRPAPRWARWCWR